jgi:Pyridoxamine 5'-phosphate oxidase
MRWQDVCDRQPRLGELARQRLIGPGVLLVVTLRRDGTPRLSPVEPWLMDGDLWLSMLWGSRKAADLGRDQRVLVHSIVTARDGAEGEVKVRGTAVPVDDLATQQTYADQVGAALGWSPVPGRFHLFRVEIDEVTLIRYDEPTGDQHVVLWPRGEEFVRRGTSATSVGEREPTTQVLVDEPGASVAG